MSLLKSVKAKTAGDAERLAWLRLIRAENVGPVSFYRLVEAYGSALKALERIPALAARGGRSKPLAIPSADVIEKEYGALRRIGGDIVTAADEHYPLALSALDDAPPVLSYIGNSALMNKSCIAMVGARNASLNGKKFAEKIARDLGRAEQIIVSGLARGIDTAAHTGALDTGTIAVVAGGIDVVYPPENQKLYEAIRERGLIVAESPLGQQPFAQSFPRRNRIVSGLSAGVVVVEATMRSGSLITARLAGEQGRDVFAVPGHPMDPRAEGPNHLIREGAQLIRGADDILEHLLSFNRTKGFADSAANDFSVPVVTGDDDPQMFDEAREAVLSVLSATPVSIDDLIRDGGLTVALAQTVLLELELAGRIQRLPGNRVALVVE
ncbi:MAG: DNA-protecting protein DprA [Proteobacteria bacterium]|nr:DNA-protecting protein DprA [Pseudomonadota bacterium]